MKRWFENVVKEGDKTTFEEKTEWIEDGEESDTYTSQYVLDGALLLKSGSGDDDAISCNEPEPELPAKLVAGANTSGRSSGSSRWKDEDGETTEQKFRRGFEIRVIGKEDLEVPAGEFEGCAKIEVSSESLDDGSFSHTKHLKWYHPGTGLVKSEAVEGGEDFIEQEKVTMPGAVE